ncbi:MAG: MucR family transcriptional regulator [Desulfovibrio sp.]|nr:MucR family transcriptional regulator [Desulfovibrio sp.]
MPIDSDDLQLFKIIYAQNPDKPMEFIQQEVLKAKLAFLENNAILAAQAEANNGNEKKVQPFVELKKSDLAIKSRQEIDEAIGTNEIVCCICRKKMKSLGAHLKRVHHVDPKEYIRVCGYPEGTNLMCLTTLDNARENTKKAQSMRRSRASSLSAQPETVIE